MGSEDWLAWQQVVGVTAFPCDVTSENPGNVEWEEV